jgi:hypothetical protein
MVLYVYQNLPAPQLVLHRATSFAIFLVDHHSSLRSICFVSFIEQGWHGSVIYSSSSKDGYGYEDDFLFIGSTRTWPKSRRVRDGYFFPPVPNPDVFIEYLNKHRVSVKTNLRQFTNQPPTQCLQCKLLEAVSSRGEKCSAFGVYGVGGTIHPPTDCVNIPEKKPFGQLTSLSSLSSFPITILRFYLNN